MNLKLSQKGKMFSLPVGKLSKKNLNNLTKVQSHPIGNIF